jgi:protein gp37
MAENSKIEWTHHTFNPWIGCTKVHTGCTHCYAEEMMDHRYGKVQWGANGTRVRTSDANWRKPIAWNKAAAKAGERHRVFCASLADVFEDWRGPVLLPNVFEVTPPYTLDDARKALFALIDATPHLDWLLLTKRPENVRRMWPFLDGNTTGVAWEFDGISGRSHKWRRNVWLGTSISDQATADAAVPKLLDCRNLCPVLFLSAEPLVGPVKNINEFCTSSDGFAYDQERGPIHRDDGGRGVDWVIVGGESGAGARRCEVEWTRRIVKDCESIGVPVFVKQMGGFVVDRNDAGFEMDADNLRAWPEPRDVRHHINGFREDYQGADCRVVLSDGKGGDWNEWPMDLRVREFPRPAIVSAQ